MIGAQATALFGHMLGLFAQAALAIWIGSMVFFSFVTTPMLFKTLARDEAGRVIRAIFPVYYRLGAACGGILVAATALRAVLSAEPRAGHGLEAMLGATMLAMTLYAWQILLPRIDQARRRAEGKDPTDPTNLEQRYFKRLHRLSVRINATVMILGMVTLTLTLLPT